jgi:hypothetical protein
VTCSVLTVVNKNSPTLTHFVSPILLLTKPSPDTMAGLGGIYKGDAEPFTTQSVNPNTTFLIADSMARTTLSNPMPTDFEVEISNAAAGARRIAHRNLQWTQPIWWHNPSDWEIRISFSGTFSGHNPFGGTTLPIGKFESASAWIISSKCMSGIATRG